MTTKVYKEVIDSMIVALRLKCHQQQQQMQLIANKMQPVNSISADVGYGMTS